MRKVILFFLVFAVLAGSGTTAFAQGAALKMDNVGIQPGETAYISVSLDGEVTGDIAGISYSYDKSVLKAVQEACTWANKGLLQDFDPATDRGVWTSGKSQTFTGEICVLAFQVRPGVEFSEATVQCTLLVKNGTETVGEYTAEAKISYVCEHSFGDWTDNGASGHSCTCESCGVTTYEPHIWGGETYTEDPENPGFLLMIKTCNTCGAVSTERTYIESDVLPTTPGSPEPEHTQPTYATNPNPREEEVVPTEPDNRTETPEPTQEPTQSTQGSEADNRTQYESASDSHKETKPSDQSEKDNNDHREEYQSNQTQNTQDDHTENGNQGNEADNDHDHAENNGHVHEETEDDGHGSGSSIESVVEPGRDYHIHINEDGEHEIHYDDPEDTGSGNTSGSSDNYHVHVDENGEYIIHYAEEGEACEALTGEGSDHDHSHAEEEANGVTVAVMVTALAVMFGGAYWYLKKKR